MTLLGKIRLSRKFGKTTYVISAVLTAAMLLLVLLDPAAVGICIILKSISIPVIWYLSSNLTRGLGVYFYLNLGISRKEFWLIPFAVEYVAFVVLMVLLVDSVHLEFGQNQVLQSACFNDEMSTDYGHIGKRVKYLPQNLFMPSNMTLDEPFSNIAPNCVEKMQVLIQEQKKNTFPIKSREDLIHHGYILR
ncbi:MAG: hypothetical protein MJY86_04125 [Bacteroidales bacterium]|nr:hypothetical protein [Bacteroidales bacterium]